MGRLPEMATPAHRAMARLLLSFPGFTSRLVFVPRAPTAARSLAPPPSSAPRQASPRGKCRGAGARGAPGTLHGIPPRGDGGGDTRERLALARAPLVDALRRPASRHRKRRDGAETTPLVLDNRREIVP